MRHLKRNIEIEIQEQETKRERRALNGECDLGESEIVIVIVRERMGQG